ncbi:hypothetical protein M413DRAFT_441414 [Hebeloma cylindrosporum]|uniref:Uncharacterized protein n=1 Tax=Hebeloma cylindrosporum TaxID=76867 RepID=A0A0C3CR16_HEBCY|nr:hypothetical protein M413DRAFT_441414 [Hebeloma cylindrosporum h7]
MPPKSFTPESSPSSYSFHGSNSSHSQDSGSGGRTYHVPNYATSYANEKSNLISVTFGGDKGTSRGAIAVVVVFLLVTAVSLSMFTWSCSQSMIQSISPGFLERSVQGPGVLDWSPTSDQEARATILGQADSDVSKSEGIAAELQVQENKGPRVGSIYWDKPQAGAHCHGFGTREYAAKLRNVPFYANGMRICEETEVSIHGVVLPRPTRCERRWPFGGIDGYWVVDFDEPNCLASWGKIRDKGCVSQGSRRFQSRLWGIKNGEDWMTLCSTAPADIAGKVIEKPTFCDDQGIWGIYGIWDLDDPSC